ncbi:MAG TPA: hypothetical protein VGF81_09315 [Solirubrobacteraceae bacterium]
MARVRADPRAALTYGEVIAAVSALLLLILMFGTKWYGVAGIPGTSAHAQAVTTQNAWGSLSVVRWVMLLTILAAGASVLVHLVDISRSTIALIRLAVALLGSLTAVLLTWRVLIDLPSPSDVVDQKLGAVAGLVCAYGIAVGGFEAIREQRARARESIQVARSQDPVVSARARR